jgi:hypothetical protein
MMQACRFLFALLAVFGTAIAVHADILHNNGPYITHPNAAHTTLGTANVSQLQNTTLGDTTLGFTDSTPFRLADDFTIPTGQTWTLTGVHVFGYSTNFTTPPSGGNVRIWSGDPGAGGTLIFDGSAINSLQSSTFDALRIAQSVNAGAPFSDSARRVFNNLLGIPNIVLTAGQYWVDWQLTPTAGAASVFGPPVTIPGQGNTSAGGFARQFNTTTLAWTGQLTHGGSLNPVDLPFVLEGTIVAIPEPGTMALVLLGSAFGLLTFSRRRD